MKFLPICSFLAVAMGMGGCISNSNTPLASGDHLRHTQQAAHYPDRLSSAQEAAAAERARLAERLREPKE